MSSGTPGTPNTPNTPGTPGTPGTPEVHIRDNQKDFMPKSDLKAQKRSGNVRSPGVPAGNPGKFFMQK